VDWLLYGANGYTAGLILPEALRRGLRPVLGGRDAAAVGALAEAHGLEARVFGLDRAGAALDGIGLVLNCAGPFSATAAPMVEACLAAGAHYVDITGEIAVFEWCHAQDDRARARGVTVLPGAGFDVVPTDCLAAMLKAGLPDATELVLAFEAGGGASRGTALTGIEGLAHGGRVRRGGALVPVPLAWKSRTFDRDGRARTVMTVPWGDVYTAYVSTGIPDVEVYCAVAPATIARLRRLRALAPLLGWAPAQRLLKSRVRAHGGPDAQRRATSDSRVWGEVRNPAGRVLARQLATPNGYDLTVTAALGIVERLLAAPPATGGFTTPSRLMGADWVLGLPGVRECAAPSSGDTGPR